MGIGGKRFLHMLHFWATFVKHFPKLKCVAWTQLAEATFGGEFQADC